MAQAKPDDFFRKLKSDPLSPVYLIYGDDAPAMDRAWSALTKQVFPDGVDELNADLFYGKEADVAEVVAAAQTLPMMGPRRLVMVRRVDEWKPPARERLNEYLAAPNPTTVLALWAQDLALKGSGAKKEDRNLVKAADQAGVAVLFEKPRMEDLPHVIRDLFKARGKKIEPLAVELLIELTGAEMLGLDQEVEKLILFLGDRDAITREDVLEATADIKEGNVFEFTDAIGGRNVEGTLQVFKKLRERKHEPLTILAMLIRHFRLVFAIQEHQKKGESPGRIANLVGLNEWVLKNKYLPSIKKFPAGDTGRIMRILSDLDLKLKSARTDHDLLFERALIELGLGRRA